jgi:hypothetical protein
MVFLLKTETGRDENGHPKYTTKWVVTPRRPADVRDPLGLSYYRRLSITEQVARGQPGLALPANYYEKVELIARRRQVQGVIPFPDSYEAQINQYRLPNSEVQRYVIPSYASHVILENTANKDEASRTTVKMYRLEHSTMTIDEFLNTRHVPNQTTSPYHPTTYRPYFLGEFNARGELLNPQEPMLYWLVPIYPRPGLTNENRRDFVDWLSIHALDTLNLSATEVDEEKYRKYVFDWNQLR